MRHVQETVAASFFFADYKELINISCSSIGIALRFNNYLYIGAITATHAALYRNTHFMTK